ncbi:MAG: hypothetical protein QOJ29_2252 [Thermoleophilaceae bacterium]|nr:hypothetical protein [Thermoleophilaceae bacterium]
MGAFDGKLRALSRSDYLIGLLFCGAYLGLALAAALVIAERQLAILPRGPRAVAIGLLTAAAASGAQLIPLLFGVLARGTALAAGALLLALAWRIPRSADAPETGDEARGDGGAARIVALAAVALGAGYVVAFLVHTRKVPIGDYDSTAFILPVPARWIQTGSMWRFDDLVPGWGYGAYPQTGSLFQLVALLPWHNDFALRLVNIPFMGLAAAAAAELAVELRAPRSAAWTFAVAAVLIPAGAAHALDHAQPDMIMAACFVAAALFLVRYLRTGARVELVLAGVGLGVALGTKWYAGPELVVLLAAWIATRAMRRERIRLALMEAAIVLGIALAIGGWWMLRNLVVGGDPLFPGKVAFLGITIFDAPATTTGSAVDFSVAHYLTHPSIVRHYIWPAFRTSFGWTSLLIALGALVAVVRGRADRRLVGVAIAAALVFVVYTLMPYSALGPADQPRFVTAGTRYAAPAVLLAGACAAAALSGASRRVLIGVQLLLVAAIFDAFRRYDTQVGSTTFHVSAKDCVVAAALVAIGAACWFAASRFSARRFALVALALALLAVGAVGRKVEESFNATRYAQVNPAFDWLRGEALRGTRIGLAGQPDRNFDAAPYLTFGPRLDNPVTFIGERRQHLLVRYKQPGPFTDALAQGRFQALLIGWDIAGKPPELAWAKAAGWREAASGGTFTVLTPPAAASARSADVSR